MTEWLNARSRPRAIASLLLIVTFLVGALAGAAMNQVLGARTAPEQTPSATAHDERRGDERERRNRGPYHALELSAEQRARVDSLLDERHRRIDEIFKRGEPEMHAVMQSTKAEIEAGLTARQRAQLEELRAQWRARRQAERQNSERGDR
jgi:Spy/CpxP family protein refolding chaperone